MSQSMPTALRDLREREAAARQRRDYHHQQFNKALAKLKALGARCPGVSCPQVQAAGLVLSRANRRDVHQPFMAFADAILEYARSEPGKYQGEGVTRLANRSMEYMRELAHHVDREETAQREHQLFTHTLGSIEAVNQDPNGPQGAGA